MKVKNPNKTVEKSKRISRELSIHHLYNINDSLNKENIYRSIVQEPKKYKSRIICIVASQCYT